MKRNDWAVFGIFDTVYLVTVCLLGKLVADLIVKLVDLFVPVSYHAGAVISVIFTTLVSVVLLGILAFRDGYRYAAFDPIGPLIASAAHFALGLLSRFWPLLCGPTRHLSGLISQGGFYNSAQKVERISFGTLALVGMIMMLVYAAVLLLSSYVGCRKRLRDRAQTLGEDGASI